MTLLLIGSVLILSSYLVTAMFLWLGAKWTRIPGITFLLALGVTLAIGSASLVVSVVFWPLWMADVPALLVLAIETGGILLVTWLIVKTLFRTSWGLAIRSWLPTLVPSIAIAAFISMVMKPHVSEAFIMPTSAMAPTLQGPHQQGRCPHCGKAATVWHNAKRPSLQPENPLGMCSSCQQAGTLTDIAPTVHKADRFLVNKLLTPQRWDLVAFRSLQDPSAQYVKRLVGLPGEEVVIKDGKIWINGVKQEPPADISRLTFGTFPDACGTPEQPMRLGDDEYFAVGDFSLRSEDSRSWGPLRGKNIEGVVSIVFFPPSRWRIVR